MTGTTMAFPGADRCCARRLNTANADPYNKSFATLNSYPAIASLLRLINILTKSSYRAEAVADQPPDLQQFTHLISTCSQLIRIMEVERLSTLGQLTTMCRHIATHQ